jgi:hypothetical protein
MLLFGTKCAFSHLEYPEGQRVFLSKTNSILKQNTVLPSPVSKLDGFLSRDMRVSSIQLNRPIWNNLSVSPFLNHDLQALFFSKTSSFLIGKQSTRCSTF